MDKLEKERVNLKSLRRKLPRGYLRAANEATGISRETISGVISGRLPYNDVVVCALIDIASQYQAHLKNINEQINSI